MPFYYANPRSGGTIQTGRTDRVEYQRSAASQVIIITLGLVDYMQSVFWHFIHVFQEITTDEKDAAYHPISNYTSHYNKSFPLSACFPIRCPDVIIAFDSFNPPRDVIHTLEEWGADVRKVSGRKSDVYTLKSPTYDQLLEIMEFPQLDHNFRPIQNHITPHAINAYLRLTIILSSLSLLIVNALCGYSEDVNEQLAFRVRIGNTVMTSAESSGDTEMEEGEVSEKEGLVSDPMPKVDSL
jgi:hypothetical protein